MGSTGHLRRTRVVALALFLLLAPLFAWAAEPADARRAWDEGRADDAYRMLRTWLLADPTDPARMLDAARLAAEMDNNGG